MNAHHYYRLIMHPYRGFLGKLDIEPFIAGFSTRVTKWPEHILFTGDPFWRLYLPLKGDFRLQYSSDEYAIIPGNLYLIPPHVPFRVKSVAPSSHYWIHFFSDNLGRIQGFNKTLAFPVEVEEFRPLFRKIIREHKAAQTITKIIGLKNDITSILGFLLDEFSKGHELKWDSGHFSEIVDYIDAHLEQPIEIAELRALTTLSGPDFSARFRHAMGVPPKQYVSIRRIAKAKMLLLRTPLSIKEIALSTGFENEFFFFRMFKKYTGLTPTQYKTKNLLE